jgi:hypothetical protein
LNSGGSVWFVLKPSQVLTPAATRAEIAPWLFYPIQQTTVSILAAALNWAAQRGAVELLRSIRQI